MMIGLSWRRLWDTWSTQSTHRRVFETILTVGALTFLCKVVAAAKEMVVAYYFGISDSLDAFLIAFLVPQFAINLIGGSLNAALIPTYIRVRQEQGQGAAQTLLSTVLVWSTCALIAFAVFLAWAASPILGIVGSGFAGEKFHLTTSLFYILLPTLVLTGISTTWGAVLNAHDRFSLVAIAPMITSVVMVGFVVLAARHWDAYTLALGTLGGATLEVAFVGWGLNRAGISWMPRWSTLSPAAREVWYQYAPMLAGACLMGGTTVVSQSMAAMLGPGSVATLAYGGKFTQVLFGVGVTAVSTAVLPHFSRMVASRDWERLSHTLSSYARWLFIVTLPVTLLLIYFSETVVALLFQRGAFTETDTLVVAHVQVFLLLQVPFYIVGILYVRAISALQGNRFLMWGAGINLAVNVVCNYLLVKWLAVDGIALSTSLMYLTSCGFLWMAARYLLRKAKAPLNVTAAISNLS